jgi:3-methyladenine DNA glycosylase/8-oxoguanine DNA glycosylase
LEGIAAVDDETAKARLAALCGVSGWTAEYGLLHGLAERGEVK